MPTQTDPVLVIITALTCGGCKKFKEQLRQPLLDKITRDGVINVTEFQFDTFTITSKPGLHNGIKKFVGFFPTLFLVPGRLWHDPNSQLEGIVYGGDEKDGKYVPKQGIKMTVDEIYNWIKNEIETNSLFFKLGGHSFPNNGNNKYRVPTIGPGKTQQKQSTASNNSDLLSYGSHNTTNSLGSDGSGYKQQLYGRGDEINGPRYIPTVGSNSQYGKTKFQPSSILPPGLDPHV